jgi:hypothetical protein
MPWSFCSFKSFIYISAANDYVSFDWIGTNEKIQLKEWFIYPKTTIKFWTSWVLEFSGAFFAKFWDL